MDAATRQRGGGHRRSHQARWLGAGLLSALSALATVATLATSFASVGGAMGGGWATIARIFDSERTIDFGISTSVLLPLTAVLALFAAIVVAPRPPGGWRIPLDEPR